MKSKKLLLTLALVGMMTGTMVGCGQNKANEKPAVESNVSTDKEKAEVRKLERNNWSEINFNALNKLIEENGMSSANYDEKCKPYIIVDWDNTSIFNDVQESLAIYQLRNLEFKMTPETFAEVIRKDIPKDNFAEACNNAEGKPVNIDLIAADIDADYKFLYENYKGFKGDKELDEIKETEEYKDFVVKTRYLYSSIGESFSSDISYPWVTYMLTGMTEEEITAVSEKSIDFSLAAEISDETLTSPESLAGQAGVVSVKIHNGLRTLPEQQDLYKTLIANGIDVYVVSASSVEVVKTFATNPKYGYEVPVKQVYGMTLKRDAEGKIMPEFEDGHPQTQGKGKTETINKFIAPKHENKGPIMIAGDSNGDYNMLVDYPEIQVGLIVNKLRTGKLGELSKKAADTVGKEEAQFFLQGRDDNKGSFRQGEETIPLGETEGKMVK